jgi:hypothetical protein
MHNLHNFQMQNKRGSAFALAFCFRLLQLSHAWAVRCRCSAGNVSLHLPKAATN